MLSIYNYAFILTSALHVEFNPDGYREGVRRSGRYAISELKSSASLAQTLDIPQR